MLIVWHLLPPLRLRELCSAVAAGPIELSPRQAFGAIQIGIGQIRPVELCQSQIRASQISTTQRGPDQERAPKPCIAEVCGGQAAHREIPPHAGLPCAGRLG